VLSIVLSRPAGIPPPLWLGPDSRGVETFYGVWRSDGRQVKRRLGVKRSSGGRDGLTAAQAEGELRRQMSETVPTVARCDRLTLSQVGERYHAHLEAQARKRATLAAVESTFRVWLDPQLGAKALDSITPEDVEGLMRAMKAAKVGAKSVRNYVGTLSAAFRFAMHPRRKWATTNPVDAIDLPPVASSDEAKFLTVHEVEALASAAVEGEHQALDRALYVTAAMTGLRQGELLALRWSDVDWQAQRVRVWRSYGLGHFDTPKSRRSIRSVPMSMRVAAELDAWHQATGWGAQDALVFAEPATGAVLRRGALLIRSPDSSTWHAPETTAYTNEAELQSLIADSPSLLPGVGHDSAAVAREVTVPGVGAADLIVVDREGAHWSPSRLCACRRRRGRRSVNCRGCSVLGHSCTTAG
jgi:integrase